MKNYFQRLKTHPGIGFAILLTILMFAAAATNKNIHSVQQFLILAGIGSAIIWAVVLISNIRR